MPVQSHTVGPCSLSQVVTAETLRGWGEPGLDAHLRGVQREYAQRAACIRAACEQVRAALCCAVLCCAICRGGGRSAASCGWQAGSSAAALWHTKHAGWARQLTCTCAPSLLLPSLPAAAPRGPGRVVCALCWHVPLAAPADRARWVGGWVGVSGLSQAAAAWLPGAVACCKAAGVLAAAWVLLMCVPREPCRPALSSHAALTCLPAPSLPDYLPACLPAPPTSPACLLQMPARCGRS
jgi:hypothetical protein